MDDNGDFLDQGFVGVAGSALVALHRSESADWFQLLGDVNQAMMQAALPAMRNAQTNRFSPEAIAVRLHLRSRQSLQGATLLIERGMIAEARMLARSLLENAFVVAALDSEPGKLVELLKKDFEASQRNMVKFIAERHSGGKKRDMTDLMAAIEAFDKQARLLSPRQVAIDGPLSDFYLHYMSLSDDAVHPTATALNRHVHVEADGTGTAWKYRCGPGEKQEIEAAIGRIILPATMIGTGITKILKDNFYCGVFDALLSRFKAMPTSKF